MSKTMKYSIRKIHKKVGRFEGFKEVTCVCVESNGNVSIIAEIHDHNLCEEHGDVDFWAAKILSALQNSGNAFASGGSSAMVIHGDVHGDLTL